MIVINLFAGPGAGKSTMADLLAEQFDLTCYHIDEVIRQRPELFTAERCPCMYKWTHTPWNVLWMQTPEQLMLEVKACYQEQFEIILQDLLSTATGNKAVLAEGNSLMPDGVVKTLSTSSRAIWVIPTEPFQRKMYRRRGDWVGHILAQCEDPELAFRRWMNRDVAFARWIKERTTALELPLLEVSGQRTIRENAELVAKCLRLR